MRARDNCTATENVRWGCVFLKEKPQGVEGRGVGWRPRVKMAGSCNSTERGGEIMIEIKNSKNRICLIACLTICKHLYVCIYRLLEQFAYSNMDIYPTEPCVKCTPTLSVSSGRQSVKRTLLEAKKQVIAWMKRSRKPIPLSSRLELGKHCLCRIDKN